MEHKNYNFFYSVKFKIILIICSIIFGIIAIYMVNSYFNRQQNEIFSSALKSSELASLIQKIYTVETKISYTGDKTYKQEVYDLLSQFKSVLKKSSNIKNNKIKQHIKHVLELTESHREMLKKIISHTINLVKKRNDFINLVVHINKKTEKIISDIDMEEAMLATEGEILSQTVSSLRRELKNILNLVNITSSNLMRAILLNKDIDNYKKEQEKINKKINLEIKNINVVIQASHREEFQKQWREITNLLLKLEELQRSTIQELISLNSIMPMVKKNVSLIDEHINKIVELSKLEIKIAGKKIKQYSLITNSVVLIFIILIGLWIYLTVVRSLEKARKFADNIARGNFRSSIQISQRDEVGEVLWGIKNVADILKDIIKEVNYLARSIRHGKLRDRGDVANFSGDFKTMLEDINSIADAFVQHFDNFSMPIIALDNDFNTLFLNKSAQELFNISEYKEKKCHEIFQTEDCNSEKCACYQSMKKKEKTSSTTRAYGGGREMDVEYFATPLIDENGDVVGALEYVVDQTQINNMLNKMRKVAKDARDISERVASSSEELAERIQYVSDGAQEQASRISETATAMEQMNSTVLEVAKNAANASESAAKAKDEAEKGEKVVNEVITAINKVSKQAEDLKKHMSVLGEKAESIGQVMQVISDIADQTNLLALNAAIEAARAGEAGRGFAVVADEVRKLAEKTMAATHEVGEAIASIQHSTKENIEGVNKASESVGEATTLADKAGEALKNIVDLSMDTSSQIQSIATAAEEQSASTEEINKNIEEINKIVSETTESVVKSSQAIEDLAKMAGELKEVIEELES